MWWGNVYFTARKTSCHSHVGGKNAVEQLQLRQVEGALQLVVVEGDLSGSGAVQPGLHEGGPGVLQEESATDVIFTDTPGAGEHRPAAVVLHCVFPEEEVGEVADIVGGDEIRFWRGEATMEGENQWEGAPSERKRSRRKNEDNQEKDEVERDEEK